MSDPGALGKRPARAKTTPHGDPCEAPATRSGTRFSALIAIVVGFGCGRMSRIDIAAVTRIPINTSRKNPRKTRPLSSCAIGGCQ
jgi:hypothetical protein